MPRRPEIGSITLYPKRPLRKADKNGFVLKFYCPVRRKRIRKNCGTRDRREARRVLKECRERLLTGEYVASGGAITAYQEQQMQFTRTSIVSSAEVVSSVSWDEAVDHYRRHKSTRVREKSLCDLLSRVSLAERIFRGYRQDHGLSESFGVPEVMTLDMLEYLQDRLLSGDEGRYDNRSPNTVNSTVTAVMTFVRFCHRRGWIESIPPVEKLDVKEVMRGRPVTGEEFERMLDATPVVVGEGVAPSWQFALRVLWESGFRIGDLMDFSWDDDRRIHPVWSTRQEECSTISIPSTQKNGRHQVIPMLPGLERLLRSVPECECSGWVVNPLPVELKGRTGRCVGDRLTKERVSRIICEIGRKAGVVVQQDDEETGRRLKYASAHDLRRGCAARLINAGVSAETLKVVMRHRDFATTERHYGATRSAQAAGSEIQQKLVSAESSNGIVGGFTGGTKEAPQLNTEELRKLKSLLNSF